MASSGSADVLFLPAVGADPAGGFGCGGTGMHPYAQRLPAPAKTGDEIYDVDMSSRYILLQEIVSTLLRDGSHIQDIYTKLRSRINAQSSKNDVAPADTMKPSTSIKNISVDYLFCAIQEHSDFTQQDLARCRSFDEDSTLALFTFLTQLPPHSKALPQCQAKPVMNRIVAKRVQQCGGRLRGTCRRPARSVGASAEPTQRCSTRPVSWWS